MECLFRWGEEKEREGELLDEEELEVVPLIVVKEGWVWEAEHLF